MAKWNHYFIADNLESAFKLIDRYSSVARIVAGGTDLVLAFNEGKLLPVEALIDISRIPELKGVELVDDHLIIYACTTLTEIIHSRLICESAPILIDTAKQIAGWQVRNLATIGGNVVNASPAADLIPPLLTLNAEVSVINKQKQRRWERLEQFLLGYRNVDLQPGELLESFRFSVQDDMQHVFRKVQLRHSMAIAMLNMALLIKINGVVIEDLRIALGAVATTSVRLHLLEQQLIGKRIDRNFGDGVFQLVKKEISPIGDFRASAEYRLSVAQGLIEEQMLAFHKNIKNQYEVK